MDLAKEDDDSKSCPLSSQWGPLSPDVQALVRNLEQSTEILKEAQVDTDGNESSPNSPDWPRWKGSSGEEQADEEMTDKETEVPATDRKRTRSSDDGTAPSTVGAAAVPKKNRTTGKKK